MPGIRVEVKNAGSIVLNATVKDASGKPKHVSYTLLPGVNEDVPADILNAAIASKTRNSLGEDISILEAMRDRGDLSWDGDDGKEAEPSKPLSQLSESEAVRVVKETFSDTQLEALKKGETRTKVLKAIDEQMRTMADATKKAKDSGKSINDPMDKAT